MIKFGRDAKPTTKAPEPRPAIVPESTSAPNEKFAPANANSTTRLQSRCSEHVDELITLCNIGQVQRLELGDYLLQSRTSTTRPMGYRILEGRIAAWPAGPENRDRAEVFEPGDWLPARCSESRSLVFSSAQAMASSCVLVIDDKLLASIDEKYQIYIFRSLFDHAASRLRTSFSSRLTEQNQTAALNDKLRFMHLDGKARSKDSALIKSVVQKIPKLPLTTATLLNKLMDENTATTEIAEIVKREPSLASMVLKQINSSEFGLSQQISDINHALSLLGFAGVHRLVMAESLRSALPETPAFQVVYKRSIEISYIAFVLAKSTGVGKPGEISTTGLVHCLGNVVIELLKQQNPKLKSLVDFFDRPMVGAELLRSWNLPENITQCVEYQDFPEFAPCEQVPENLRANVSLLHVAILCYRILNKIGIKEAATVNLPSYFAVLHCEDMSIEQVLNQHVIKNLQKQRNFLPQSLIKRLGDPLV